MGTRRAQQGKGVCWRVCDERDREDQEVIIGMFCFLWEVLFYTLLWGRLFLCGDEMPLAYQNGVALQSSPERCESGQQQQYSHLASYPCLLLA